MRSNIAFMLAILIVSIPAVSNFPLRVDESPLLRFEVEGVFRGEILQTVRIENSGSRTVHHGELLIPMIRNDTPNQFVTSTSFAAEELQPILLTDQSGNVYASFKNVEIEPGKELLLGIEYAVLSFDLKYIPSPIPAQKVDTDEQPQSPSEYTLPEQLIQSDSSEIVSTAQSLTGGLNDTHEKVSAIFDYTISHLNYASQNSERGALWALENGTGDCSEYSYLFVALCRAAGIPARIKAGFAFQSRNEVLENGHMWAQYFLPTSGWITVDPTWKQFDGVDEMHLNSLQSVPEMGGYFNYFFNYTEGPPESEIVDSQLISAKPSMKDSNEGLLADIVNAVQRVRQTSPVVFAAKQPIFFHVLASESADAVRDFLTGEIELQRAIDAFTASPQSSELHVQNVVNHIGEASQRAWIVLISELAVLFSISILALVGHLFPKGKTP